MRNVFPTKTFVNHFTIATGLYSETHGVLDNYMFDGNGDQMHYTYEQFHCDGAIVPIWIHNQNSGGGRHSGVMMWPGSEFAYQGKQPTYLQKYNKSMSWTSRVDTFMSWITNENKPANLVFVYFEEPDSTGHLKGVESQEVKNQIVRADVTVKYILDQIKDSKLEDVINLIVLSDHGMDTVTYDGIIFLDKYVTNTSHKIIITGANAFVRPHPGKFNEVYMNLTKGATASGKFNVYKQDELLDRWHMKNTSRMKGLIYLLAKRSNGFWDEYFEFILNQTSKENFRAGSHGYDNEEPLMRAIFMASGPAFKKSFAAQPFDNIDIFPLISHIAGLEQIPSGVRPNGTMANVRQLLVPDNIKSAAIPMQLAYIPGILALLRTVVGYL